MVTSAAPAENKVSDELALLAYRQVTVLRIVDVRLAALQRQGRVASRAASRGEEIAVVAAAAALRERDWIFPSSRELGAALWRGLSLQAFAHGLFGNAHDAAKGRITPDALASRRARIASPAGVPGAHVAHAAGFAWAAKSRREDTVALAYVDEVAASAADFHTALNFAGVFKLPLVVLAVSSTPPLGAKVKRPANPTAIASRGVAYGVGGARVDGGDLLAVLDAVRDAVVRAASGGGATVVEAQVPRQSPNEALGARDPVARARRWLEARGLWSEAKQAELETQIEREVAIAVAEAEKAPPPERETIFDDVYAALPPHLVEQRAALAATRRNETGPSSTRPNERNKE